MFHHLRGFRHLMRVTRRLGKNGKFRVKSIKYILYLYSHINCHEKNKTTIIRITQLPTPTRGEHFPEFAKKNWGKVSHFFGFWGRV